MYLTKGHFITVNVMLLNASLLGIVSIILIIIFACYFSKSVLRRISYIENTIDKLEEQNFNNLLAINYDDELGIIEKRLNKFIMKIRDLLNEIKKTEQDKRTAELFALQSQINPHFLYNTLDSINWLAIEANNEEISKSISLLGRFLRISLSGNQAFIPLKLEIEHIECYIKIQQIRFDGKLNVIWNIDDNILDCKIPKIILQPFIENSVIHGFINPGLHEGTIKISGCVKDRIISVTIQDNGQGFNQFDIIKKDKYEERYYNKSYGINNIRERLFLIYGNKASISIVSKIKDGTTVTISWPAEYF